MSQDKKLVFRHSFIDPQTVSSNNSICLVGDINNDGFVDVVIGSYADSPTGEGYLVWYEYPKWTRYIIARANLEAGGVLVDINNDGRLDIVAGEPYYGRNLYWFENPPDPRGPWIKHIIDDSFQKYHDQAVGDIDGDGENEILISSQGSKILAYYDIPPEPATSPWPKECRHLICDDISVEGLMIIDLDGDDINEVIAGPNIFKHKPSGKWDRKILHELHARTYNGIIFSETRVQVADLNEDGVLDIIMSEAESDVGRLVWFVGPEYKMHIINDSLFHPHSLGVADFNGDGHIDIFVGEMHLGRNPNPKLLIYLNNGDGIFTEHIIDGETGTHEAKVADIGNTGRPSIVGKPFKPKTQVDLWKNLTS